MPTALAHIVLSNGPAPAGVTAGTQPPPTTLNGATLVGASTATLTSAAAFRPGMIVLIDTGQLAEVALIASIAGNVITFSDGGLVYAHANLAAVAVAVLPLAGARESNLGGPRSPYLAGG